jgi:hypothetical protein
VIFKFITTIIKNWKNESIKDEQLTYHEDEGYNILEKETINKMLVTSLVNIALCDKKLSKFPEARNACNEALIRDPKNVKAL